MPMPLLAALVGLLCGLSVWLVLDLFQSQALREIFSRELQTRLAGPGDADPL